MNSASSHDSEPCASASAGLDGGMAGRQDRPHRISSICVETLLSMSTILLRFPIRMISVGGKSYRANVLRSAWRPPPAIRVQLRHFGGSGHRIVLVQSSSPTKSDFLFEGAGHGCTFVIKAELFGS
jgi:hypothetical protein